MSIADDMVRDGNVTLSNMVRKQGHAFIELVEKLYNDPRLREMAWVVETDESMLVALITCAGVNQAVQRFPGSKQERQNLYLQLVMGQEDQK